MRRFDPDYIKMKKILDSGELGAPLMAHCISRTRSHPKNHTTEQHITNIAIHEIDICRWLLGENLNEVAVRFPRATCFAEGTCQDPQLVLMQSDSGVLIDVEVSGNSYYGYEIPVRTGLRERHHPPAGSGRADRPLPACSAARPSRRTGPTVS